ncbi:surfactant protein B [Teladorsagia circumcincta]|nr:surfactant protein B [Teladorsagia circumcincta]
MKRLILAAILVITLAGAHPRPNELPTMCSLCKDAVDVVARMLDKSLPEIEKIYVAECEVLFSFLPFFQVECQALAARDIPPIKRYLESGTAPKDVCHKLKAC